MLDLTIYMELGMVLEHFLMSMKVCLRIFGNLEQDAGRTFFVNRTSILIVCLQNLVCLFVTEYVLIFK